jgi:SAM-dependent methyltransferase
MRRFNVRAVAFIAGTITGAILLVARSRNARLHGLRKRLTRDTLGVPSGPLGWISSRVMPLVAGPVYQLMATELELVSEDDLLEVACGSGPFLARHASHVRYVAGLDLSELQVALGRRRLADRIAAGTAEIVRGDAVALPWEDGRFSAVVCNSIVGFHEPERALAEMCRVLRPGGRAVVMMNARVPEGTPSRLDDYACWEWNEPDARRLMEDAGFTDVAVFYDDVMGWKGAMSMRGVKRPATVQVDAPVSVAASLVGSGVG